jgi:hypothetical protein
MGEKMSMKEKCKIFHEKVTGADKWRYTLYTTVLFLIIVNPMTYKLVNMLLGSLVKICDSKGCPTMLGIVVHAIVFTLLLRCLMDLDI